MAVKAEFVISARDHTREAIEGAQRRLESLDRTVRMLRYAFTGYVFAEFMRGVKATRVPARRRAHRPPPVGVPAVADRSSMASQERAERFVLFVLVVGALAGLAMAVAAVAMA